MRFTFDDEQKMLQSAVRGALERDAPLERVRAWSDARDLSPMGALAARQGWTAIGVGEADGGQGGGLVEQAILFEELGRAAAPSGGLLAGAIATALAGPQLPAVLEGTCAAAVVWQADRPLDADGPRDGVPLVLAAPEARLLLIPANATLRAVARDAPSVRVDERRLVDRTRRFGDVTVGAAPARELELRSSLAAVGARAAVLIAAESLGLARRMLEMTVSYTRDRRQFGVAIGSFQAVKHAAAEALVAIEAVHSGVYYAAWAIEHGRSDGPLTAWIVKAYSTETAARVADVALQLHGAIGYTWEYDLHVFFKRAKANVQLLGDPRVYRARIADALRLCAD